MERDTPGGSDVGRDIERDLGDEPPPSYRDSAPDYLAPIDDSSPVSGHTPAPESDDLRRRFARARLGPRPGPDLSRLPPGRDAGPRHRLARPRPRSPRTVRSATPSRCSTSGRPACRSSTRSTPARTTSSSMATTCCRGASSRRRSRTRRWPTCALVRDRRRGPTRSPAIAGSSAPTPATAGTPPGSCCPRSSPTSPTELASYGRDPRRAAGATPPDGGLAAPGRRRLRRAVRGVRARAVGRRRRADRPARLRAGGRAPGRVRRGRPSA